MSRFFSHPLPNPLRALLGAGLSLLVSACVTGKLTEPMPSILVPAPQAAASHPLVIVLPGRYDSLQDLQSNGIAPAIQQSWPIADVLLVGATPPYYMDGGLVRRLREQVIVPARQKGYRDIWLSGASQGGLGTLLYERALPGDVTGLVLFAPYMGNTSLIRQIANAGGAARWQPPMPRPVAADIDNYLIENWRAVHDWSSDTARVRNVWLACGSDDDLLPAAKLIAAQLPPGHFVELPGGHDWKVWDKAATRIFAQVAGISATK
ncbi:MAG: alpha/beta hydrolase [Gammaproteobacteria bacterium]